MLSQASLSIIIPCRNAARWLGEAIESARAQTVRPSEILVIDDGSSDDSPRIARSFGSPVRLIRSRWRGCNGARHTGVIESRGEFIAFVDADDVLAPAKHERQLELLEDADPFTIAHTGSINFWDDASRPARIRYGTERATGRCTRVIFESNPVCGASVMARRTTILALGSYRPRIAMSGDYHFSLLASPRCDFLCVSEPLYYIRRHARNSTNQLSLKTWYHWLAQDDFRRERPAAFAELPPESIRQYMHEPVIRAAKEAYWRRDPRCYRRLLRLAIQFAPHDAELQVLCHRRWYPMMMLRLRDRFVRLVSEPRSPSRWCVPAKAGPRQPVDADTAASCRAPRDICWGENSLPPAPAQDSDPSAATSDFPGRDMAEVEA